MRISICLIITILSFNCNAADSNKENKWHSYEKVEFKVDGRDCHIILPKEHSNGKPWVWRARFPDWHVEMDLLLLEKGISVAYMDVSDLFGSPTAVKHWDEFYKYMTGNGYCKCPAIEAVSRGGLIAYNWAKKNPKKVACIYAESPVCDIKSWPGNSRTENQQDWGNALLAYSMSEQQLLKYLDNPIDNLDGLAKEKIPILHMVNPADEVVPIKENTMTLISRYIDLGGIATVAANTTGPQKLKGHHFPIENVKYGADFIATNLKYKTQ